ncbi:fibrinogen C domain-containing protein 1-like [Lucilia sericata]|uniref:fibrinogen C domain-containing protein 1-like n=1 Tax=Lucilia sericata TaxID=13632 RepID=UPI0018A82DB3|nr:fibrinogen C domain-containing protein 1-like [Lucilia sericata]
MFYFKSFCKSLVLISFIFEILALENNECNKLVIEGGEQALRKLFSDFIEIKTTMQELKAKLEDYQEFNETKNKDLPMFDIRVDTLPQKCQRNSLPKDCAEATACTHHSGFYKIQIPPYTEPPFYVECDAKTDGGDWIVIQRRQDGSVEFYRNWDEYQLGFGDIDGEFFIGLHKLYALTNNNGPQELLIEMEDVNQKTAFAKYDAFAIANETDMYKLKKLGRYSGTAGDSLQDSVGCKFTTKDRHNDRNSENCAVMYIGAWWYKACHLSNLNGQYGNNEFGKGINWKTFSTYTASLKYVRMMIRRRRF